MSGLSEQQVEAAVNWWADRLKAPTFRTLSEQERGRRDSEPAAMDEMMATAFARPPADAAIERFKTALAQRLRAGEAMWGLGVDYGPDPVLADAAVEAGINGAGTTFPWKTHMAFRHGGVQASRGYAAPFVELLPERSEARATDAPEVPRG